MEPVVIKRALISVSDKTGIIEFSKMLSEQGVEILSTGGTWKLLSQNGIPVTAVDSYTGHPEIMDGRVKTLHPRVHGGILGVRDKLEHVKAMERCGILPIDMVVVNLYPFEQTVAGGASISEAIENIDIGGPAMVRSGAKNHAYVTVVIDPADYGVIVSEMADGGAVSFETRKRLAAKAFRHTADYDSMIDTYLSKTYLDEEVLRLRLEDGQTLRYGENPHQEAVFYKDTKITEASMASAAQLGGKELSYNNIVDGDAALEAVKELTDLPGAAIIKHTNPCGYATGKTLEEALSAAWSGDPVSAFGGVIAVNRVVDTGTAKVLAGRFVELLIAPGFDGDALEFLKQKSSALRILQVGNLAGRVKETFMLKHVTGGLLKQGRDNALFDKWDVVTKTRFPDTKQKLAAFAYKACKHVKSNAIILAQEYQEGLHRITGIGAGQPNRVDALRKLAVTKAADNLRNEYNEAGKSIPTSQFPEFGEFVMASDAFFPFADTIEEANAYGIRFIVQPGGSKRDSEVIEACDKFGIAMVFTGMRHFKH
ncbi:MAG: bifunctional phosphoribosylaminoimidazolecarboxamide formyltransferase/IMP cyclohydrolase [Chitinispirillales bacterium]|jgi:phosphoribosylaminoimidazolecarboxamide formyltransferase/IMP cyclohydrolase|nr:bifunctional phosphoribosylaminoimidazolecarboxamide formyltransferase/IMP cyclohydrolase [Chitinispirillales bacterium]